MRERPGEVGGMEADRIKIQLYTCMEFSETYICIHTEQGYHFLLDKLFWKVNIGPYFIKAVHKMKTFVNYCSFFFSFYLFILIFETGFLYEVLAILELVDQAGLRFTEIILLCLVSAGTKDVCHNMPQYPAIVFWFYFFFAFFFW